MEYTITIGMGNLDWAARTMQLIFGLGQLAFSTTLYVYSSVAWRFSPSPKGYMIPLLPLAMAILLISGIGLCFCKNHQYVHWKIMSVLDWLAVLATLASVPLCGVATGSANNASLRFFVVLNICTVGSLLSSFFLAVRRHRPTETALQVPKLESYYPREDGLEGGNPETVRSIRRVSQAMSRAETNARWSGVSGADTTVFANMADAVPPYHNDGRTSPVNSMLKE